MGGGDNNVERRAPGKSGSMRNRGCLARLAQWPLGKVVDYYREGHL
jgi:hypothetical protein